jgi:hypothetical protein
VIAVNRSSIWQSAPVWACWVVLVIFPADSARSQTLKDLIGSVGSGLPAATTAPHPSVARVIVPERGGTSYGSGSLVDVHRDYAIVVTNWHVVSDRVGDVTVQFPDGFQSVGKVLKVDKDWDLAAIGIWRPNVQPLRFAERAPVIGEPLAIAGYGPGQWRLAPGRCSQFVSPGSNFPADMVEVSVEARQGDSGGPIFNQQGEIAGVLFGAGRGATSGSHAPRVRMFLESVYPILREAPAANIASNAPPADIETAKPPVIAQANWDQNRAAATSVDERDVRSVAITYEEPQRATAPLVAAKPTPRRATEKELREWVAPSSEDSVSNEPVSANASEASQSQVDTFQVARIHRRQLDKTLDSGATRDSTLNRSTRMVEPQDQTDCAKFDPAFPSLKGGVEEEVFSLSASEAVVPVMQSIGEAPLPREGLFEQGKLFLAMVGGVTILLQLVKLLGGKS